MDQIWIQALTIIGANLAVFLTIVGLMIKLHIHTDKKIDAIHEEMKDFHRSLVAIEERNSVKVFKG